MGLQKIFTDVELRAHKTKYMLGTPWICVYCGNFNYSLAGKYKHLQTVKHKNNFDQLKNIIIDEKPSKRPFFPWGVKTFTDLELRERIRRYRDTPWICTYCNNRNYTLVGKHTHLKTKKHKKNFETHHILA